MNAPEPRIDPRLAVDLEDARKRSELKAQAEAAKNHEREISHVKAWDKAMRRAFGRRDRFRPFIRAEARRQARERGEL